MSADGSEVDSGDEYFDNYGRVRDVCVNPHTGSVYFCTNGPWYPGSGPNQIVEYTNLNFSPIGIEDNTQLDQFSKVSPNPMTEAMTVKFSPNFVGSTYEVISYDGKVVMNRPIITSTETLFKADLRAGNYYLRATNKAGTITKAFVVN